jgi:hypothetical protein
VTLRASRGAAIATNGTGPAAATADLREGVVEETVATGGDPDHVDVADGSAYVVDKSGEGVGGTDQVTRIRFTH